MNPEPKNHLQLYTSVTYVKFWAREPSFLEDIFTTILKLFTAAFVGNFCCLVTGTLQSGRTRSN